MIFFSKNQKTILKIKEKFLNFFCVFKKIKLKKIIKFFYFLKKNKNFYQQIKYLKFNFFFGFNLKFIYKNFSLNFLENLIYKDKKKEKKNIFINDLNFTNLFLKNLNDLNLNTEKESKIKNFFFFFKTIFLDFERINFLLHFNLMKFKFKYNLFIYFYLFLFKI